MRAVIFGDLQGRDGSERLRSNPSVSLQLWRVERCYDALAKIAQDYRCDAIWDLGDTCDDRTGIDYKTLDALSVGMRKVCIGTRAITNFKLIGNHEQHLKNTLVHAGHVFERHFHVVDSVKAVRLHGNVWAVMAAFPRDDNETANWIVKTVGALRQGKAKVIFLGHLQLKGCRMASGSSSAGIPMEVLNEVDVGLLGHVHLPQSHGNVHYVGSPFQQDFGEAGDDKRAAVLDTETLELTWVPLVGFPRYRAVDFAELSSMNDLGEDRVRVALRSPAETEAFYRHPLAGQVEAVYAYSEQAKAQERQTVATLTNPADMLDSYVKDRPLEGFDQTEILRYGREIAGLS
jgi:hypothetical protein